MKSLAELRELRDKLQKDINMRNDQDKPQIIVGMGTCGIAAGAREILQTALTEIDKRNLDVNISQTGCIGMCEKEPLLDVKMPGKNRITYGNLKSNDVKKIIVQHIINGNIVEDLVIARHDE
ncbi:MAG: (2Fe-2S) ferredoxin domain-containing protein [Halanaerobiales bacterium]